MSPSAEAIELLHESRRMHRARPLFTERRRWPRFWKTWGRYIAAALLCVWYAFSKGLL